MKLLRIGFDVLLISFIVLGCSYAKELPKVKYQQSDIAIKVNRQVGDTLFVKVNNTVYCSVRVVAFGDTINVSGLSDTTICFFESEDKKINRWNVLYGNPERIIHKNILSLPFSKGKTYKIIQAYNGGFFHNEAYSRYAIDFNLKTGETVCAADSGFVVGVIEGYKYGSSDPKFRGNDNFITIYHPHSGLYTQYAHLKYKGALVKVGDKVGRGQAIGLSGNTGFSGGPHLHFNVLIPQKGTDLVSTQAEFEKGIKGIDLKKGDLISNSL